jgi:uncharacterized protein (TIGR02246 family)
MKRIFSTIVMIVAVSTFVFGQSQATQAVRQTVNVTPDARIRQIIADQVAAWNVGDEKAFSRSVSADVSFTNIRGTVFYGHQVFEDRHREIFQGFFKGSKLAMSVSKIRYVRPDVAIVDVITDISQLQGRPPGVNVSADGRIHTRLQEVFVKEGENWFITSYHNVDVKED